MYELNKMGKNSLTSAEYGRDSQQPTKKKQENIVKFISPLYE